MGITVNFPLPNAPYIYRPLKYRPPDPMQRGWDVFAVQTALVANGRSVGPDGSDGYLGQNTDYAIRKFQSLKGLTVDGIAGIITQRALVLPLAASLTANYALPSHLLTGWVESESGFQLGNHTALYEDGSRDMGVAQDNESDTFEKRKLAFKTPTALELLAVRASSYAHVRYLNQPGAQTPQRRWELAVGSWNRPAWTDYLANSAKWPLPYPFTQDMRDWIEGYIDRTTAYVTNWPS